MRSASAYRNIALAIVAALAVTGTFSPARADDCPGASALDSSFIVERDGRKVSVFHLADGIVRTIYRVRGVTALETTEFQGLFPLERIDDRGRRKTFQPKADLKTLFPLRVGQKITATFDTEESGRASTVTFALIVKKTDTVYIGACKYAVFQIEKSEGRGGKVPALIYIEYYAANLKMVIAKEYKERGGASSWIKYDKIYSTER